MGLQSPSLFPGINPGRGVGGGGPCPPVSSRGGIRALAAGYPPVKRAIFPPHSPARGCPEDPGCQEAGPCPTRPPGGGGRWGPVDWRPGPVGYPCSRARLPRMGGPWRGGRLPVGCGWGQNPARGLPGGPGEPGSGPLPNPSPPCGGAGGGGGPWIGYPGPWGTRSSRATVIPGWAAPRRGHRGTRAGHRYP